MRCVMKNKRNCVGVSEEKATLEMWLMHELIPGQKNSVNIRTRGGTGWHLNPQGWRSLRTMGERKCSSTHSYTRQYMQWIVIFITRLFAPEKERLKSTEEEVGWAKWSRQKRLDAHGNRTPIPRSSSRGIVSNLSLYEHAIFTNLATSLKNFLSSEDSTRKLLNSSLIVWGPDFL
jgi:hypothetical protein